MNEDLLIGLAATAVPLLALGFVFLRRNPAILRFFLALLLVGLGYLGVTGALGDIGRMVQGESSPVVQPVVAPTPAEVQPTPPAVEPPAAEPEPAPLPPGDTPIGEPSPPAVETTPEEVMPEPEASPPPAEITPGDGAPPSDALPPANP